MEETSKNTRANAGAPEVDGADDEEVGKAGEDDGEGGEEGEGESEFRKWFWEKRGDINRAWKKRRREALKAKRVVENRKVGGARRVV